MKLVQALNLAIQHDNRHEQVRLAKAILHAIPAYPQSILSTALRVLQSACPDSVDSQVYAVHSDVVSNDDLSLVLTSDLFDSSYYSIVSNLYFESRVDAVRHFLEEGWRQGFSPSAQFSADFYLTCNPDVKFSEINPLVHYLRFGVNEGRQPVAPEASNKSDLNTDYDFQYVAWHRPNLPSSHLIPKTIAFYLPQFHEIPENNSWWGDGFTEWSNVKKAQPLFPDHQQPKVPGELGYYDLSTPDTLRRQARIASAYGIHGFCFYFYWFDGKTLLEKPLQALLDSPDIPVNYCLCWANENWSRTWDGLDNEILIAQKHSPSDDLDFIEHISRYLKDPRYIRVNDKPLLILYRPNLLPNAADTAKRWRQWCLENGIGEILLAVTHSFESLDPTAIGFDLAIEFTPNNTNPRRLDPVSIGIKDDFQGAVYDWRSLLERSRHYIDPGYPLARCICPGWDNTPRKGKRGNIFVGATPRLFVEFTENAMRYATSCNSMSMVFVNAWNEWGEGAVLEPTMDHGYAYLDAFRQGQANVNSQIRHREELHKPTPFSAALVIHAFYPELLPEIFSYHKNSDGFLIFSRIIITSPPDKLDACRHYIKAYEHLGIILLSTENRGRDIRPFMEVLSLLCKIDIKYVCKIHTKKSLHRADGDQWRRVIYDSLLGLNAFAVINSIGSKNDCGIGLLAPKDHLLPMDSYWGLNRDAVLRFGARMGLSASEILSSAFPAGSMFWARTNAISPLLALIDCDNFEYEAGQIDGTCAHAIERLFSLSASRVGYRSVEFDSNSNLGYSEISNAKPRWLRFVSN